MSRRPITAQEVEATGVDFIMWVTELALRQDCHLMWLRLPSGSIQPVLWVLPGDPGYGSSNEDESSSKEVPRLRRSHQ